MLSLCPIQQESDRLALMSIHHFWNPLGHLKDGHWLPSSLHQFPHLLRIRGHTWIDNIEESSKWWHSLYWNAMWMYQEAPSYSFLSDFSCCMGISFINSPPSRGLSPIITALRDLLTEVPELPDPPVVAAAWNACIKSGWACRTTSNIKWEIPSTHQKRNNISFREVRTTPTKKQASDWNPEAFYSSQFFFLIIQYLGVGNMNLGRLH